MSILNEPVNTTCPKCGFAGNPWRAMYCRRCQYVFRVVVPSLSYDEVFNPDAPPYWQDFGRLKRDWQDPQRHEFADALTAATTMINRGRGYTPHPYEVDHLAVHKAANILGVTWKTAVHRCAEVDRYLDDGGTIAVYAGEFIHGPAKGHQIRTKHHHIYVHRLLHPTIASVALWHELVHARQAEAFPHPAEFGLRYNFRYADKFTRDPAEYVARPEEAEAYASSPYHWDKFPLTRRA